MIELRQPIYDADWDWDDEDFKGPITIKGEKFSVLLDVCFEYASYFSLTKAPWTNSTDTELEKELEPFFIKEISVQKWFCYNFTLRDQFLEINIYKASPTAKDIILKYCDNLFLYKIENDTLGSSAQTLEDLCIFSESSLLMGTVSHEGICHIYPENKQMEEKILPLGLWKHREDIVSNQINIREFL